MRVPDVDVPSGPDALARLLKGNRRYLESRLEHPDQSDARRIELRAGQHPFATVLGCADSRVPPEVIFDQGLGDIFTVRVAGNVLDDLVLASIEYAELHLRSPLVMVLGHSGCGAVEAALRGRGLEGHLPSLTAAIRPAIDTCGEAAGIDEVVKENARQIALRIIDRGAHFRELIGSGALLVVAAYYDLASGEVTILSRSDRA